MTLLHSLCRLDFSSRDVIEHETETNEDNNGSGDGLQQNDEDDDLIMEWNKYIFFKDVEDDMRIKKFQENLNVWQLVFDIGEQYLIDKKLIDEDDDGNWIKKV